MNRTLLKSPLTLLMLIAMLAGFGCHAQSTPTPPPNTPTITPSSTPSATYTPTFTPTPTETSTLANTITPQPSKTPTPTSTAYPTLSLTPSPTDAPPRPAQLFPYQDVNGKTVDWSYTHVTQIGFNREDQVNELWAFMAFQLLDRGIHQRNFKFLDETITVFYLNVAHNFNGELLPMQLVLGGTAGANIVIEDIPARESAYIQFQVRESWQSFDPYIIHRDANREYELRQTDYTLRPIHDLQTILPTLPDEVILLADHPILFPFDDWHQIKLDMSRVNTLAARYQPFFEIGVLDRLVDQSDFAYALRDHLLDNREMPEGIYAYSSKTLIIITGEE